MFVPDKRKEGNGSKREGRIFQILTVLYEDKMSGANKSGENVGMTSTQIAHALGLAPSWYVRDILHEMSANGWITGWMRDKNNGATAYVWAIMEFVEFTERWRGAFVAWYPEIQQTLL